MTKALGAPNSITIEEYWAILSFIILAAMYVGVAVIVSFFPIICLDGELQWSNGIMAFMTKLEK